MRRPSEFDFVPEHHIFWTLVKRYKRPDVGYVYLAIQAALGFKVERIDVGWMIGRLMPDGHGTNDSYCPGIGARGLAFFNFLFETELTDAGGTDYHEYRFTRRYDGASTIAYLKTSLNPESTDFVESYEREKRKLTKARDKLLVNNRWYTTAELFKLYFPDAIHLDLGDAPKTEDSE